MKGLFYLLFPLFAAAFLAVPAAGAAVVEIDAPGGYEKKGDLIVARGAGGRPVTVSYSAYRLTARLIRYDQRRGTVSAEGEARWRDRDAQPAREIAADLLRFAMAGETIEAEGSVVLRAAGLLLRARSIRAEPAKGSYLVSGAPARAVLDGREIEAAEIRYDEARSSLEARGGLRYRSRDGMEIRAAEAGELSYDLAARRGIVSGGLVASRGDWLLTAGELRYEEEADLYALAGAPSLSRAGLLLRAGRMVWRPAAGIATASEGVEIHDSGYDGSAGEAVYDGNAGLIRLKGGARITRGADLLTGEEICYEWAADHVTVDGGARAVLAVEGEVLGTH